MYIFARVLLLLPLLFFSAQAKSHCGSELEFTQTPKAVQQLSEGSPLQTRVYKILQYLVTYQLVNKRGVTEQVDIPIDLYLPFLNKVNGKLVHASGVIESEKDNLKNSLYSGEVLKNASVELEKTQNNLTKIMKNKKVSQDEIGSIIQQTAYFMSFHTSETYAATIIDYLKIKRPDSEAIVILTKLLAGKNIKEFSTLIRSAEFSLSGVLVQYLKVLDQKFEIQKTSDKNDVFSNPIETRTILPAWGIPTELTHILAAVSGVHIISLPENFRSYDGVFLTPTYHYAIHDIFHKKKIEYQNSFSKLSEYVFNRKIFFGLLKEIKHFGDEKLKYSIVLMLGIYFHEAGKTSLLTLHEDFKNYPDQVVREMINLSFNYGEKAYFSDNAEREEYFYSASRYIKKYLEQYVNN